MKKLVHIGANTGQNDESVRLVKDEEYWGLFVEPNPKCCAALNILLASYEARVVIKQVAIRSKTGLGVLYIDGDDPTSPHASFDLEFIHAHGHAKTKAIALTVDCITLQDLLTSHHLNAIDRLMIDTEGCDAEIILSTNFSKFQINKIIFEHSHTDGPCTQGVRFDEILRYLGAFGYSIVKVDGYNTMAFKSF